MVTPAHTSNRHHYHLQVQGITPETKVHDLVQFLQSRATAPFSTTEVLYYSPNMGELCVCARESREKKELLVDFLIFWFAVVLW